MERKNKNNLPGCLSVIFIQTLDHLWVIENIGILHEKTIIQHIYYNLPSGTQLIEDGDKIQTQAF